MKGTLEAQKVTELHDAIIEEFGGLKGIISLPLLELSIKKPFLGLADGTEFYPDLIDKAAALIESIIRAHPFADGNKRTAAVLTKLFLEENKIHWDFTDKEIVGFVIQIAQNKLTFQEIKKWITTRIN